MFTHNSNANASAMVTMCADELETVFQEMAGTSPGGGVLPIVGYTGGLRPKGVPFLSSQYIKR